MQHLSEFLSSKKLPVSDVLHSFCLISEKIDGSAFQYYNDNGNIIFGKRGSTPNRLSPNHITEFDILTSSMYANAYNIISQCKLPDNIQILNFEIFDNNNQHIIKYSDIFKNNIVLLSGYYSDGNSILIEDLIDIANRLDVSVNENIYEGCLLEDDINIILNNKDNDEIIWNTITKYCENINFYSIEGLVLTFKNENNEVIRICKVQNPEFQKKIMSHLSDEQKVKESINLEDIYDICIDGYTISDSKYTHPIAKLLELYMAFEYGSKDYFDIEKKLDNLDILVNMEINMKMGQGYYSLLPDNIDDIAYPNLLKFILLVFRNKRAKFPLWCSLDYQLNKVNPFVETYILKN